jgi:zinc protease
MQNNLSALLLSILSFYNPLNLGANTELKTTPAVETYNFQLGQNLTTQMFKLENGLHVFLTENKQAPIVSIQHWVRGGSLHETIGLTGMAHLFEHMMFRPVGNSKQGFMNEIKTLSGEANANTRFDATVYTTSVPLSGLKKTIELEANRFKNLQVTDELLDVERKAVWSEYSTKFDSSPQMDLWYSLYRSAFPGHPYGWTVIGLREDLDKIKAKDCNQFFKEVYRPNNTALFISGPINLPETIKLVQAQYGDWQSGEVRTRPKPFQKETKYTVVEGRLTSQSRIVLAGFRIPEFSAENIHLLQAVNWIFYESDFSLANRKLEIESRSVSGIASSGFEYDSGMIKFRALLEKSTSLDGFIAEVLSLNQMLEQLPQAEFDAYLKEKRISLAEELQRNESLNGELALNWGKYGSIKFLTESLENKNQPTKEQVLNFAKKHFVKNNLVVAHSKGFQK